MNRYEWTPASEPPDTSRTVIVWDGDEWLPYHYVLGGGFLHYVTHWRDVEPPTASPHTVSEEE